MTDGPGKIPHRKHKHHHAPAPSAKKEKVEDGAKTIAREAGQNTDTSAAKKVLDDFVNVGAGAVGLLEVAGVPVPTLSKPYQAKVNDLVTRGSKKTPQEIADAGFKAELNLEAENDDTSQAAALHLTALYLPVLDNTAPTPAEIKKAVDFMVAHPGVYVHCLEGKGRTGTIVACYRMAACDWSPARALAEAETFGDIFTPTPDQKAAIVAFGKALGWVEQADGSWKRTSPSTVPFYPLNPPLPSAPTSP